MRNIAVLAALFLSTPYGLAQGQTSLAQVADSSPFRALALTAPNDVRTGSGRPGPKYWQQQANYKITATLDPARNELRGRETIHYINRSPDPLPYLWMFVEQNLCAPGSITNQLNQPPLVFLDATFDFSCQGFNGGLTLESLRIAGASAAHTIYGTTMRVDLAAPLAPGAALDIDVAWRFNVPPMGGGRMGHDGPLYEIAQWYPRMTVYDDVRGWNHEPYIGAGEFYLEYGNFDVSLTVPGSYIVAATGELANPEQVLTPTQRTRLAAARRSETPIAIIGADEAGNVEKTRPRISGAGQPLVVDSARSLTWHFTATNVRDFAFAAGPNFRWDASGYNGILIESLYRPSADKWPEVNRMGREAIKYFSEQWYRYPWSHATTVEGPIEGMEYPMLTFTPNSHTREDLQWVIAHEFGHEWFPMTVGSNERLYPWMDEGFNTFIDLGNAAKYFQGTPYGDSIEVHPLHLYHDHARAGQEQPLITNPTQVRDLFWVGYQKPALMMQTLRYEVLGKERFDPAFREYIKTWAFKHPTPADFFRMMRDQSGVDLDWFWRGWIYSTARLDQAVDSVSARADGGSNVYLSNRGTMVMPAELSLTFADGTRTTIKLPVEMWNLGSQFVYRVPEKKRVTRAEVDQRRTLPDVDRQNNVWPTVSMAQSTPAPQQSSPRYSSKVTIYDVASRSAKVVYEADAVWEAPNWSRDGKFLLSNSGGKLYRIPVDGASAPELVNLDPSLRCNNDHDFSPDGKLIAISASSPSSPQSRIYVANADGSNHRLVTSAAPSYFHGWSPDGKQLSFVANRDGKQYDLYRVPATGGEEERLTVDPAYDDGTDYSRDGKWIYFNSNRGGGWNIWRIPADGGGPGDQRAQRITNDDLEDWFPHPSPDGNSLLFLSFPRGTEGHNDRNLRVQLRMIPMPADSLHDVKPRVMIELTGGQGTINVNSWSPDSRRFAYVSYEQRP